MEIKLSVREDTLANVILSGLASILSDNTDAVTGDVLIQVAAFGEIRYG